MAVLKVNSSSIEVKDGDRLLKPAQELGVPFGCTAGICGTCIVNVEEGMENLSERTQEEIDMELEQGQRLMCQCKINQGEVKISF